MDRLKPLVSVVMAVYKEDIEHIKQSVESILSQTLSHFEFLIIVDNPNYSQAISLLKDYEQRDARIILLYNDTNMGLAFSSNKAIEVAKAAYVARMDADDVALPHRLKKQLSYMQNNPTVDLLFGWADYIDQEGNKLKQFRPDISKANHPKKYFFRDILFAHPTLIAKSDILLDNPYDSSFRRSQDFELWLRLIGEDKKFAIIAESLLEYRVPAQLDIKTRVKKVRQSTYWTLKALGKHVGSYWNNLFYLIFCVKTFVLFLVFRLPIPFFNIYNRYIKGIT